MDNDLQARLRALKLLVLDVDGVISDGKLYLGPDGAEWRSTSVRDGLGLKALSAAGITTAVISGRPAGGLDTRLRALGVSRLYFGRDDKLPLYQELVEALNIAPGEAAMIGDDIPDLTLFRATGLGFCPANAHPEVLAAAAWISRYDGGEGAVREVCDLILAAQRAA